GALRHPPRTLQSLIYRYSDFTEPQVAFLVGVAAGQFVPAPPCQVTKLLPGFAAAVSLVSLRPASVVMLAELNTMQTGTVQPVQDGEPTVLAFEIVQRAMPYSWPVNSVTTAAACTALTQRIRASFARPCFASW